MKGFVSYSHEDIDVCRMLAAHLAAFSKIEFRIDYKQLRAGQHLDPQIANWIAEGQVHILMVSAYSIVSPYIMNVEIPAIQAKRGQGDLVLPLVVGKCRHQVVTNGLTPAPHDTKQRLKAVRDWRRIDNGLDKACQEFQSEILQSFGIDPCPPIVNWGQP